MRATAEMIADDEWLRTGDLGYVDHDGNVVVDRLEELIKVSSYQVAPAELEECCSRIAAVLGRPDQQRGEVPMAMVVAASTVDALGKILRRLPRRSTRPSLTSAAAGQHPW
jgi:acyl-coenzyme A synthetase/AMP-(fatty) acid ligase